MTDWSKIVGAFAAPIAHNEPTRPPTHKRCIACQHSLPLSKFYERPGHGGHAARCKPCYSKKQHENQKKREGRTQ